VSNSGQIRAGKAYVEMGLDLAPLRAGLASLRSTISGIGPSLGLAGGAVGGFGLAALAGLDLLENKFLDRASEIRQFATLTGDSAENLSRFAYAASTVGLSLEDLKGFRENFSERVYQATQGAGEGLAAFQKLGLDIRELSKLKYTDQLKAVMTAMRGLDDDAKQGVASSLGGDQFQQLLRLSAVGSAGLARLMADSDRLGQTLTTSQVETAAKVSQAYARVGAAIDGVLLTLGEILVPSNKFMNTWVSGAEHAIVAVRKWVLENGELVQTFEYGVYAVLGLGAAGIAASAGLYTASAALGGLFIPLQAAGAVVSAVMTATLIPLKLGLSALAVSKIALASIWSFSSATMAAAWLGATSVILVGKALIITGMFAIAAAVVAIPTAVAAYAASWVSSNFKIAGSIRSLASDVSGGFRDSFGDVMTGWQLVQSAIGRGNFSGAFEGLKLVGETTWLRLMIYFRGQWNSFADQFGETWADITKNVMTVFRTEFVGMLSSLLSDLKQFGSSAISVLALATPQAKALQLVTGVGAAKGPPAGGPNQPPEALKDKPDLAKQNEERLAREKADRDRRLNEDRQKLQDKQFELFLAGTVDTAMNAIQSAMGALNDAAKAGRLSDQKDKKQLATVVSSLRGVFGGDIVRGTFGATRVEPLNMMADIGRKQLAQQQVTNEHAAKTAKNVEALNNKATPLVFGGES
jgi:hypothetical protein